MIYTMLGIVGYASSFETSYKDDRERFRVTRLAQKTSLSLELGWTACEEENGSLKVFTIID